MIRSMTGFGSGKAKSKSGTAIVEIKTVNHKFLEITCKLPNGLALFEDKVKVLLDREIKRGKVYFNCLVEGDTSGKDTVFLDTGLAKGYYKKLVELKNIFKLDEKISLKDIVAYPGVISHAIMESRATKMLPAMQAAIDTALRRLVNEREKEGRVILDDFKERLEKIRKLTAVVETRTHMNVASYKQKLETRIKEISGLTPANNDRLELEVALYAKNSDISEEITRLSGHVKNFDNIIRKNGEAGKKLDFIAQEMHREANTIGSKSSDYTISKSVIEIKSEIEKIREQVKNVE